MSAWLDLSHSVDPQPNSKTSSFCLESCLKTFLMLTNLNIILKASSNWAQTCLTCLLRFCMFNHRYINPRYLGFIHLWFNCIDVWWIAYHYQHLTHDYDGFHFVLHTFSTPQLLLVTMQSADPHWCMATIGWHFVLAKHLHSCITVEMKWAGLRSSSHKESNSPAASKPFVRLFSTLLALIAFCTVNQQVLCVEWRVETQVLATWFSWVSVPTSACWLIN